MESKILVVEDDCDFSRALRRCLERNQYAVICASDGYEALYKYVKEKPGVVLLDILLPKLNGFEVCREIRREMNDMLTPIIMMTGDHGDYVRIKGKVVGATHYLTKPFALEELLGKLRDISVNM